MDKRRSLRWSGYYVLVTFGTGLVGAALVVAGLALSGPDAQAAYEEGTTLVDLLATTAPGLVLAVAGLVVYRLGRAWALYWTFGAALAEELGETYDTAQVKSEMLSVLDGRLSEMHQDIKELGSDGGNNALGGVTDGGRDRDTRE